MTAALPIEAEPLIIRDSAYQGNQNDQWVYRFPNDYGASVVRGPYTYGGRAGLYEIAVLKFTGPGPLDSEITYATPVTADVLGWQTLEDVAAVLLRVAAL